MQIINHVDKRQQLCDFFTALGKGLAEIAPELEQSIVVTIDGDPGCGKSIISDHIIHGSITVDSRELDAHFHKHSKFSFAEELEPEDLKYFDEYNNYDNTERVYELWTGQGNDAQDLHAFFCNSAVLPKEDDVQTIQSLMRHPQENATLPDNLRALYEHEDARAYFDDVADFILVTNSGDSRHMSPDLSINLVWSDFDDMSKGRDIELVLSEDSPVYDRVLEVFQNNEGIFPSHNE